MLILMFTPSKTITSYGNVSGSYTEKNDVLEYWILFDSDDREGSERKYVAGVINRYSKNSENHPKFTWENIGENLYINNELIPTSKKSFTLITNDDAGQPTAINLHADLISDIFEKYFEDTDPYRKKFNSGLQQDVESLLHKKIANQSE